MKKQFGKVQVYKPAFQTAFIYIVGQFFGKLRGKAENFLSRCNLQTCTFSNRQPWKGVPVMLSLQLKSGEYLTIGDDIVVQVFERHHPRGGEGPP